jgi:hypothetical protein
MKESAIERHLARRIHRIGGECLKFVSPGRVGVPDRLVVLPGGEVTWVELKAEKGALSPVQIRMHARLRQLDQTVLTLYSTKDIDRRFPLE